MVLDYRFGTKNKSRLTAKITKPATASFKKSVGGILNARRLLDDPHRRENLKIEAKRFFQLKKRISGTVDNQHLSL